MATAVYLVTLSFLLGYQGVDSAQECFRNFTSLSGVILSPNYPGNYSNHDNCVYLIMAPDNHDITLTFINFGLENCTDCRCGYVEVRDGDSHKSPRIGRYCGQTLPNRIRTSGHQMWINFVSDLNATMRGFRATYSTGQRPSNADTSKQIPDITIIAGGSVSGVCFLLVLTVCIVCIVKRKHTRNVTVRTPAPVTVQRVEGNRYSVPIAGRNSQVFPNRVYENLDMGPTESGIYELVE